MPLQPDGKNLVREMSDSSSSFPLLKAKSTSGDSDYNEENLNDAEAKAPSQSHFRSWARRHQGGWIVLHLCIIMAYTTFYVLALCGVLASSVDCGFKHSEVGPQDLLLTPMDEAVKHQVRTVRNSVNATSKYKGPPSPEVDRAWRDLFNNNNLRVSAEDMKMLNRTSVMFNDGSGDFLATPDTYHQLHCLWYIFQNVHSEFYTVNPTIVSVSDHVDHCIDSIRIFIQCHATTSVQTYSWIPNMRIPFPNFEVPNVCVEWGTYDKWVKRHSVDEYEPGLLIHPTLGPSFPDGKPKHEFHHVSHSE